jgi:hypothetical protein
MVACACNSIDSGNTKVGQPEQKARPYLQNNQSKKGWTDGSRVRVPA